MNKHLISLLLLISGNAIAQVPRNVIVEHFSNTWCSICASRNPGFYSNLNSQNGILHIAYHPSAPYAGCILNQHNKPQNDGRTKFYGIYGSTPRLVIQGNVISSSSNYSSPAIFTPYLGQTSPFEISILQDKMSGTNMIQQVKIKAVAAHSYTAAKLYIAIAEDTLFYTGPNGESMHFDVFRKALTDSNGLTINVPVFGDSLVLNYSTTINSAWTINKLLSVAIMQEMGTNEVLQAEKTVAAQNDVISTTGINQPQLMDISVIPNPSKDFITLTIPTKSIIPFKLYDLTGRNLLIGNYNGTPINIKQLETGIYFIVVAIDNRPRIIKFSKE